MLTKYGFMALTEGGFHQAANREINKNTSFTYALYVYLLLMVNYLPFFTITFLFLTKKITGVFWKA